MLIIVVREVMKADYTIGSLYANGRWICNTLEPHCIDWEKEQKVMGKTAIPEGRYQVEVKRSPKFGRKMPYLKDVPHFSDIMIHTGNAPAHTKGCILVGYNTIRGLVLKSHEAMEKVMNAIMYANEKEERIWCEVRSAKVNRLHGYTVTRLIG